MNLAAKAAACAVPLALMVTGCAPSPEDLARQETAITAMLNTSQNCPTIGQYAGGSAEHNARLRVVLSNAWTGSVETLNARGTMVCLDRAFSTAQGDAYRPLTGVYHQSTNMARLWDDSSPMTADSYPNTVRYGYKAINRLASRFESGEHGDAVAKWARSGKHSKSSKWRDPDGWGDITTTYAGILQPMQRLEPVGIR
jgi:hypothetical protein